MIKRGHDARVNNLYYSIIIQKIESTSKYIDSESYIAFNNVKILCVFFNQTLKRNYVQYTLFEIK